MWNLQLFCIKCLVQTLNGPRWQYRHVGSEIFDMAQSSQDTAIEMSVHTVPDVIWITYSYRRKSSEEKKKLKTEKHFEFTGFKGVNADMLSK